MIKYLNPKNYLLYFFNTAYSTLSPVIAIWEKKYIDKYANQPLKHQPIFIVGAPRTGSTILYQTLTNQLDVLYVDNLVCRFSKNFFFGFWLSNKLFKQKAHNCFKSDHGDTSKCGLRAPNECGKYWYRWLPSDKHFIDYNDLTGNMIKEIREEITTAINFFDKPLLFKNLNAGQRVRLLHKCFPEAKFIFIKREPMFTAQSILKAKRKIGIDNNAFWSVRPKNYKELEQLSSYEQIVKQIFYIEKQIVEDKTLFEHNNFLTIEYNDFRTTVESTLQTCQTFISTKSRSNYDKAKVTLTETLTLDESERKEFDTEIKKLNWITYHDK